LGDSKSRAESAAALRAEAHGLLTQSGLFALLAERFGDPTVTGSASYDLMVRRQLDIHLAIEATRLPEWIGFATELSAHLEQVGLALPRATFANGYVEPGPLGHGLYWGLFIKDFAGQPWQVDLWGWDPFDYAVRQARDFTLKTDLGSCDRDTILRLKMEARARDNYYGRRVVAWDIYQMVLAGAGDSLTALEAWKAKG
jgi:hypothetical protein